MTEAVACQRIRERLRASARAFSTNARNPNLRRAQLSFGAAIASEWAVLVAIGVVAFRDGGAVAVGIVAFTRMAPAALLAPFGTALADRFRRERVLLWSCLLRAVPLSAAAALLAADGPLLGVYALAVVANGIYTTYRPSHSALLPVLCRTPPELTSANIVRGFIDSISVLAGPLLAAFLLNVASPAAAFASVAALSVVAGLLLVGTSYEAPPRERPAPLARIIAETVDGFRGLLRYREAGLVMWVGLAQTFTRGCLNVFVVVLAFEVLDTGEPGVGVLTGAVGAGAVVGSLAASVFVGCRRLAVIEGAGVALWGLPLVLCSPISDATAVFALLALIGVGNALVDIGLYTLVPRLVPESMLARVFGAFQSGVVLTMALGSLVTPFVIHLLGIRGALVALGLVAPVSVALAWPRLRAIDASIQRRDNEIEVLKRVRMLRPLPMPAIDLLAGNVRHLACPAGQDVIRQGDDGDHFYVIDTGEADVLADGRLVATIGAGQGFGEIALLRDTTRTTTVSARTELRLYTLERVGFIAAVGSYQSCTHEAEELITTRLRACEV
jgi:MFS family permease